MPLRLRPGLHRSLPAGGAVVSRVHPDDTIEGLSRLAPYSPTAAYVLDRRLRQPLRLSRRGDLAAVQLLEQLGRSEAHRWLRDLDDALDDR